MRCSPCPAIHAPPTHAGARSLCTPLKRPAERQQEQHALARGMWGEEPGDVIVEEREAGCDEPERIRGQVELPCGDGRLELSDAIAAVAEMRQQGSEIDEEIDVGGGIGSQVLVQGKPPGEVPKGTALEQL